MPVLHELLRICHWREKCSLTFAILSHVAQHVHTQRWLRHVKRPQCPRFIPLAPPGSPAHPCAIPFPCRRFLRLVGPVSTPAGPPDGGPSSNPTPLTARPVTTTRRIVGKSKTPLCWLPLTIVVRVSSCDSDRCDSSSLSCEAY